VRLRLSESCIVPSPGRVVLDLLRQVSDYPAWWPKNLAVRVLHSGGPAAGAEILVRPRLGHPYRACLEDGENPGEVRLRFTGGSLLGSGAFLVEDQPEGCRVRFSIEAVAKGLDVAVVNEVTALDRKHAAEMRGLLRSLARQARSTSAPPGGEAESGAWQETLRRRAEERARREAEAEAARVAAEEKARREAEAEAARIAAEAEAARIAAEEKARREAEAEAARVAAEEKARREAVAEAARIAAEAEAARVAADEKARQEAEAEAARIAAEVEAARIAAEEKARQAAEAEAARIAAEAEAARVAAEAEAARVAAEKKARQEAEAEAARVAAEAEAARVAAEEKARQEAEAEAARIAAEAEAARVAAEAEAARVAAEEKARQEAEAEAARIAAEAEAARIAAEAEAARVAAEDKARQEAEAEAARIAAEAEAARIAAEEKARREAEAEAARIAAEVEAARVAAEEKARQEAEAEAARIAAEVEAARVAAEEKARQEAEAEAARIAAEVEAARVAAEEKARQEAEAEAARIAAEAEAARIAAEAEAARVAAEEKARQEAEAEAARIAAEGAIAAEARRRVAAEKKARQEGEAEAARIAAEAEAARVAAEAEAARIAAEVEAARIAAIKALEAPARPEATRPKESPGWAGQIASWLRDPFGSGIESPPAPTPRTPATPLSGNMARAWRHFELLTKAPGEASRFLAEGASCEILHGPWPSALPLPPLDRLGLHIESATGGGSRVALEVVGTTAGHNIEGALLLTFKGELVTRQTVYLCLSTMPRPEGVPGRPRDVQAEPPTGPSGSGALAASNFHIARRLLSAMDAGADSDDILSFFTPDATITDPPKPQLQGLGAIRHSRDESLAGLVWERHDLRGASGDGSELAVEVSRTALERDASRLDQAPSKERNVLFLTFREGRIARLRIYRCPLVDPG
jgi:hypothetical protein